MRVLPRNLLLALLVAALAAAHLVLEPPRPAQREILPLLAGFDVNAVTRVRISSGAQTTTLLRGAPAEAFAVQEKLGAPARAGQVTSFLAALASMTDLDVVGEGAAAREARDLDGAAATAIELAGAAGTLATVRAVDAVGGAAFVAVDGDDRVVRVPRFRTPPADPRSWFETYLLVPNVRRDLAELRVEGAARPEPVVVRARPGDLTAYVDGAGRPLDPADVAELVRALRSGTALDVVPAPEGVEEAPLALQVTSLDGTSFRISVTDLGESSGAGEERPGIAFRSDMDFAVAVSPAWIQRVLDAAGRVGP